MEFGMDGSSSGRRKRALQPESRTRIQRLKRDADAFWLARRVARAREVSLKQLLQGGQSRGHLGLSRQLAMYLVHVLLGRTQERVGALFCRPHQTVSYACRNVELLRDDRAFDAMIERIEVEAARMFADG
jgi:chromosomal replication initiation ATPase DnaA